MRIDTLLGAALDSSGDFDGCERLPAALRRAGLAEWPVRDAGTVQAVLASTDRDPATGILAGRDLVAASCRIRDAISALLRDGATPLVLGGDCSILLGVLAGAEDARPGIGLILLDGHFDLHTPETSETGAAADMEMTLLLGDGPTIPPGDGAVLDASRVAFLGARDHGEMRRLGSRLPAESHPDALVVDAAALAAGAAATAGAAALDHLAAGGATGHWVHIDFDVLSTEAMPAVDYPQNGGLDWDALAAIVRPLVVADGLRGVSVAVLNPRLPGGEAAVRDAAEWLGRMLDAPVRASRGQGGGATSPAAAFVERYLTAWRSNDPDDVRAAFHPDIEYRDLPASAPARGIDEVVALWSRQRDEPGTWSFDWHVEVEAAHGATVKAVTTYHREPEPYVFDNLWQLRFTDGGQVVGFTDWWVERPRA